MTVFILGYEYSRSMLFGGFGWAQIGIVGSKEEALEACTGREHFYIEWELGRVLERGDMLDKAHLNGEMIFPNKRFF